MMELQWIWAWVSIWVIGSAEKAYKDGYAGNCYPDYASYDCASKIFCSSLCATKNCAFYTYSNDVCKVYGAGEDVGSSNSRLYRSFEYKEIPNTLTNVALNKPTLPNVQLEDFASSRVVDGDMRTQYHSLTRESAWWSVDLQSLYYIRTITVLPADEYPERFQDVKIYTGSIEVTDGDFSSYIKIAHYTDTYGFGDGRNKASEI